MSEEVKLSEILKEAVSTTAEEAKKTSSSDDMSWKEMIKVLKELIELRAKMSQMTMPPTPPPAKGGKRDPNEVANMLWNYAVGFIGTIADQFPDMTLKEVKEKLPQFEGIAKAELAKLAKNL